MSFLFQFALKYGHLDRIRHDEHDSIETEPKSQRTPECGELEV